MASDHGEGSEAELEREFRAGPRRGLEYLNKHFRRNIFALLKSRSPHSQPAELADLFQETMRRMVKAACQQGFDPRRPMRLVQNIAAKVAVDAYRKKMPLPIGGGSEIETLLCGRLKESRVAQRLASIAREDMQKALSSIDDAISELPNKQGIAATAMRDVFEEVYDSGSWEPLRRRIEEITGDEITAEQAYDNWRAARKKIAAQLRRAGLDLLGEE